MMRLLYHSAITAFSLPVSVVWWEDRTLDVRIMKQHFYHCVATALFLPIVTNGGCTRTLDLRMMKLGFYHCAIVTAHPIALLSLPSYNIIFG
jgi:hypothetical protein